MTWQDIALKHAKNDSPFEACGLVVVHKGKEKYFPCKNLADDMNHQFIIDPDDWVKAEDKGEVVAVFHSHPKTPPTPSQADLASCEYLDLPFYIVNPEVEQWYSFKPSGYKNGLIGREWVWGIQDCCTLIYDWFDQVKGIKLKKWQTPKTPEEFRDNPLFEDKIPLTGFRELQENEDLQVGDVLLMKGTKDKLDHVALYVGDQTVFQHCRKRLSSRETYDGYLIKCTKKRYRYAQ